MSNQYPEETPERNRNQTLTIIASVLGVLLLIAAPVIGWLWANQDSDEDNVATATRTTTQAPPDSGTVTVTDTREQTIEETVEQTVETVVTEPAPTTATTVAAPPADICDPAVFKEDGHNFVDVVLLCESGWARGGMYQTDYVRVFHQVNDSWEIYPPAGETPDTGYPCYDTQAMSAEGAPDLLLQEVLGCE